MPYPNAYALADAHEELNPYVSDWVFSGRGDAKTALIDAYNGLSNQQKSALAEEIRSVMPPTLTVYRSVRPTRSSMGGVSVTDDVDTRSGDQIHAWEITPDDVILHHKQKDSWLGNKTYAHEREIILKPNATPRYIGEMTPASRVATRHIESAYDPYRPRSAEEVLDTHLFTHHEPDELNTDIQNNASPRTALLKRARAWALPEFVEYMEQYAWNNNIETLRRSLENEPLEYRIIVKGKVKGKGFTSESELPNLRESIVDNYTFRKWADELEIVTRPRPASDWKKLDALVKAKSEREIAWAKMYADLRTLRPEIEPPDVTSHAITIIVRDQGVAVGGIAISYVEHTARLEFDGCSKNIRELADKYGDGEVWAVPKSTLWPEYRGQGLGLALYLKGIEALRTRGKRPTYLEAHQCLTQSQNIFGITSADALRVWAKLTTRFPSSGTVIAIV